MLTDRRLRELLATFRAAGGIARTKHDATDAIVAVSIGQLPSGQYRRLGAPGAGWLPVIAAAELMQEAIHDAAQ